MKSIIGAGLILAAMMQPALAQTKLETFKAEAQAALEDQNIAGAALALVGPEGPIGQMCFGLADKDKGNRINGATAFTLGSTSKIFIGVALAQAVEKGQISLDQPIAHFLDFEIGSKNVFGDGALVLNATAFYYKYKGLQLSRIIARTSVNDTIDADVYGVELEGILRPDPDVMINLGFSYLKTKVVGDQLFSNPRDPGGGDANAVIIKDITNGSNCAVTGAAAGGPDAFVAAINGG
ncbi:serine hydrolase, partial [uncultured Maritalea sp.]|uniref:serine hydrolase n=1 Tax=uncultured Maritalea sp. TaxID=757249 RepID=UPI002630900D